MHEIYARDGTSIARCAAHSFRRHTYRSQALLGLAWNPQFSTCMLLGVLREQLLRQMRLMPCREVCREEAKASQDGGGSRSIRLARKKLFEYGYRVYDEESLLRVHSVGPYIAGVRSQLSAILACCIHVQSSCP